jgi:preprotein translocase subunit SecG
MSNTKQDQMAFSARNYQLLVVGLCIVVLGYVLMSGGGSGDPSVFNAKELFSARRITMAPIVVVAGYLFVMYAILKRPSHGA